jgi:hypothetical protein
MKLKLTLAVLLVLILASASIAAPITYSNALTFTSNGAISTDQGTGSLLSYGYGSVNGLDGFGDYLRWSHALSFEPQAGPAAVNGTLSLSFRDAGNQRFDSPEIAFDFADSGPYAIGDVDPGVYSCNVIFNNGSLFVTLASLGGDFYLDRSSLRLNYNSCQDPIPEPAPVPEPSTLLLLGLGLLSTGAVIKRSTKNRSD